MADQSELFARDLKVATAGLEPAAINALLARTARSALQTAIQNGEASERYTRAVNGRVNASEDSVQAPGPIIYQFDYLEEVALYALVFCQQRSPVQSGDYKKAWFVLVNGMKWDRRSPIPIAAEVVVTNDQPYHRKIEVGAMTMKVPPHIIESARQSVLRRYAGSVTAQMSYVRLTNGYVLKGRFRRGVTGKARGGLKKDTRVGQPMTYPALVIQSL